MTTFLRKLSGVFVVSALCCSFGFAEETKSSPEINLPELWCFADVNSNENAGTINVSSAGIATIDMRIRTGNKDQLVDVTLAGNIQPIPNISCVNNNCVDRYRINLFDNMGTVEFTAPNPDSQKNSQDEVKLNDGTRFPLTCVRC